MQHCQTELGEDNFHYMMGFDTPSQLISEIDKLIQTTRNRGVPRFLRQLKPHITQVQTFVIGALVLFDLSAIESLCIWGLMTFTLLVCLK